MAAKGDECSMVRGYMVCECCEMDQARRSNGFLWGGYQFVRVECLMNWWAEDSGAIGVNEDMNSQ